MFVGTVFSMLALARCKVFAGLGVSFETDLNVFTTEKMLTLISKVSPSTLLFVFTKSKLVIAADFLFHFAGLILNFTESF